MSGRLIEVERRIEAPAASLCALLVERPDGATVVEWRVRVEPLPESARAIVDVLQSVIERSADGLAARAETGRRRR